MSEERAQPTGQKRRCVVGRMSQTQSMGEAKKIALVKLQHLVSGFNHFVRERRLFGHEMRITAYLHSPNVIDMYLGSSPVMGNIDMRDVEWMSMLDLGCTGNRTLQHMQGHRIMKLEGWHVVHTWLLEYMNRQIIATPRWPCAVSASRAMLVSHHPTFGNTYFVYDSSCHVIVMVNAPYARLFRFELIHEHLLLLPLLPGLQLIVEEYTFDNVHCSTDSMYCSTSQERVKRRSALSTRGKAFDFDLAFGLVQPRCPGNECPWHSCLRLRLLGNECPPPPPPPPPTAEDKPIVVAVAPVAPVVAMDKVKALEALSSGDFGKFLDLQDHPKYLSNICLDDIKGYDEFFLRALNSITACSYAPGADSMARTLVVSACALNQQHSNNMTSNATGTYNPLAYRYSEDQLVRLLPTVVVPDDVYKTMNGQVLKQGEETRQLLHLWLPYAIPLTWALEFMREAPPQTVYYFLVLSRPDTKTHQIHTYAAFYQRQSEKSEQDIIAFLDSMGDYRIKQETHLQPYSDTQAKKHNWPFARQVAKRSNAAGSGYCTSFQGFLESFGFASMTNCLTYAAAAIVKLSLLPTEMIIRISKEWRLLYNEIHQPLFEALYMGVQAHTSKLVKTFHSNPKGRRVMVGFDPEKRIKFATFQTECSTQNLPLRCKVILDGNGKKQTIENSVMGCFSLTTTKSSSSSSSRLFLATQRTYVYTWT